MFSRTPTTRYGLLIDVGSGSVSFSIVASEQGATDPKIIWSRREYLKVGTLKALTDNAKALISTLTDMALTIGSEGLPALHDACGTTARITELQVSVSAPWSYTINRSITYEQPHDFLVTEDLIDELAAAAREEARQQFQTNNPQEAALVTETSHAVLDIYANGYRLPVIQKQKTNNLVLSHSTTLVYTPLVEALQEVQDKLFAKADLHTTSSLVTLYYATRMLRPHVYDVCLVHITAEATEIGIVRDGSLTYCTHTAFGHNALVRELQAITDRPLSELVLRLDDIIAEQSTTIAPALETYREKIVELFKETGDSLAIPRTVYLSASTVDQAAFTQHITQAAGTASKTTSTVVPISDFTTTEGDDGVTASLSRFFHTQGKRSHFQYI